MSPFCLSAASVQSSNHTAVVEVAAFSLSCSPHSSCCYFITVLHCRAITPQPWLRLHRNWHHCGGFWGALRVKWVEWRLGWDLPKEKIKVTKEWKKFLEGLRAEVFSEGKKQRNKDGQIECWQIDCWLSLEVKQTCHKRVGVDPGDGWRTVCGCVSVCVWEMQ